MSQPRYLLKGRILLHLLDRRLRRSRSKCVLLKSTIERANGSSFAVEA